MGETRRLAFLTLVLCAASLACGGGGAGRGDAGGSRGHGLRPNVLLITVDTLRPDHLGCYGYARRTSPNVDRLAARGVLFRQAITAAGRTVQSFPSILMGVYPMVHGLRYEGQSYEALGERPTLTGVLKRADKRVDAREFGHGVAAIAEQCEAVKEAFRSSRDKLHVQFELVCIVNEFGKPIVADVKSKILGGDIFQVVGFIENDGAVVRQYGGDIGFANREIRKKEMVIHHNNIGLHRLLPDEREKASLVILAFRAKTSIPARVHA